VVQINPSQYQRSFNLKYNSSDAQGKPAGNLQFQGVEEGDLNLEFVLDSTGVVNNSLFPGEGIISLFDKEETIGEKMTRLRKVIYDPIDSTHEPFGANKKEFLKED